MDNEFVIRLHGLITRCEIMGYWGMAENLRNILTIELLSLNDDKNITG